MNNVFVRGGVAFLLLGAMGCGAGSTGAASRSALENEQMACAKQVVARGNCASDASQEWIGLGAKVIRECGAMDEDLLSTALEVSPCGG